jgi:hypothetical protein
MKFLIEVSVLCTLTVDMLFVVSLSLTDALENRCILNLFRGVVVWMQNAQIQLAHNSVLLRMYIFTHSQNVFMAAN